MEENRQEIERKLSSRHLSTDCQKDEKLFRATLLKAASHHIPTGRRKLYTQQVPAEILAMMEERDDLRKQDPACPRLSTMNDEITKATPDHKRRQWGEFVENIDHRTSVKYDQVFFGVESIMSVNAASLDIRDATTSTPGTLNDLTTDLILANNNHRTDSTKLWRTIKRIDGTSNQTPDNEGITFTGRPLTSYPR